MLARLLDRYWRWRADRDAAVPRPWEASLRAAGFYPAYADWVGIFGVDESGQVWFVEHGEAWSARQRVAEPELQFAARAVAARRHPRVPMLALVRAPDDPECSSCGGSGVPPIAPKHRHRVICQCGGLGWIRKDFRAWADRPDRLAFLDPPRV